MKSVNWYRKFVVMICTMALCVFTVTGCGQNTEPASDNTEAAVEEKAAEEKAAEETAAEEPAQEEENADKTPEEKAPEEKAPEEKASEETEEASEAQGGSETASAGMEAITIDEMGSCLAAAAGSGEIPIEEYLVFASDTMGFSFLYSPDHTAYISPTGAAVIAIEGDTARTGLFVSVSDAEYMPSPEDYFEEEIFNLQQRYLNAMAVQPELYETDIEGHHIIGILYSYSTPQGGTIDCTEFIEVRDDKYIFYHTRAPREKSGPELTAMGVAMASVEFDAGYYGESDASEGSLPIDEFDTEYSGSSGNAGTAGNAAQASAGDDFESDFYFDTDESFMILSDKDVAQVYTGGAMEGSYFSVERVDLPESIGDTIVSRTKEVADMLSVRMIGQPEVQTMETGSRRLAGFVTRYSAVDGSKTLIAEEFYEEFDGSTYCWYAVYDEGDETTPKAMAHAIETFALK